MLVQVMPFGGDVSGSESGDFEGHWRSFSPVDGPGEHHVLKSVE